MNIKIINLERGLPYVAEAMDRLDYNIQCMKDRGEKHAIVIHGYGKRTHGGGKIKEATRTHLQDLARSGYIRKVVYGEKFSIFDSLGSQLCGTYSDVREYATGRNIGICVIEV